MTIDSLLITLSIISVRKIFTAIVPLLKEKFANVLQLALDDRLYALHVLLETKAKWGRPKSISRTFILKKKKNWMIIRKGIQISAGFENDRLLVNKT